MERTKKECKQILKKVVEGILSGELEHNQEAYHCGTAHCVAGWYEMETLEGGYAYDCNGDAFENINTKELIPYSPRFFKDAYESVIGEETGIDRGLLFCLFSSSNTIGDIKRMWKQIEEKYYETK